MSDELEEIRQKKIQQMQEDIIRQQQAQEEEKVLEIQRWEMAKWIDQV